MFKFFCKAISFFTITLTFSLSSQNIGLSPYSKTALGDISTETGSRDSDMGHTGTASNTPNALSTSNPAFYHYQVYPLVPAKFAYFDFSLTGKASAFRSSTGNDATFGANLNRIALLLPMNKYSKSLHKWGSVIMAKPYASMNYEISGVSVVSGDTLNYGYSNSGKGGLTEIMWGNGVKLSKNWMVGLNTSYVFGKYLKDNKTAMEGTNYSYSYADENRQTYVVLRPGIAYVNHLEKYDTVKTVKTKVDSLTGKSYKDTLVEYKKVPSRTMLSFGATYEYGYALSNTSRVTKKIYDSYLTEYILDTLSQQNLTKYNLPGQFKFGTSVVHLDEYMLLPDWALTMDVGYRQWSLYNPSLNYRNTVSLGLGMEKQVLLGKKNNQRSLLSNWRAGAYYQQLPYSFNNTYIDEMGLTFGATLKLKGIKSLQDIMLLNAGIAVGQRGKNTNNLIAEKFIKFTLGFTFLEDRWFWKYRLD